MSDIPTYPEILQIEISTLCNFSCAMCLRNGRENHSKSIDISLYRKIAKEAFPNVKKIVLYGVGEPLMHPDFLEILKITRKHLPPTGLIDFTTNGALLTPELLTQILPYGINRIVVSLDTSNFNRLQKMREGASEDVLNNLKNLSTFRQSNKIQELAIESVVMRSNLYDLPDLIEFCHNLKVDSIFISHVLPYHEEMIKETLYIPQSKESWEISRQILEETWDHFSSLIQSTLYTKANKGGPEKLLAKSKAKITLARESGIDINLPAIIGNYQKLAIIEDTKRIFHEVQTLADDYQIRLELPFIFPDLTRRECPYAAKKAILINVQGELVPCYNLLHSHQIHVNDHIRDEIPFQYGSLATHSIEELYNSKKFTELKKFLRDMRKTAEWCGDCTYSSLDCFYINTNENDCLGNSPNCNECLFSVGIVKCIF
ncbi:GTP 3',8-cyclase [Candidatus Lokiarchaeum ossiferum]|uniref:GTP 3',8-cyclase n=1 Tax=Candidatus Lokiarchaeum ossiferum TaxID=2951803 RepID=A0ABY6HR00_9ARCH|nr:GTP 3',8-cyclase [Candidatus Lokiarchaeum sp. B-35]